MHLVFRLFAPLLLAAPAVAEAQTFSGPHAEAVVGWNHIDRDVSFRNGEGIVYGGGFGYDLRAGRVVGGAVAELTDSSKSACADSYVAAGKVGTSCSHNGRTVFAGARIGIVAGDHTLIYALGGYANIRQRNSYISQGATTADDFEDTQSRGAYRVGGGTELAIGPKIFVKAEYRYTNVKDNVGASQHQVISGFGIRF